MFKQHNKQRHFQRLEAVITNLAVLSLAFAFGYIKKAKIPQHEADVNLNLPSY